MKKLAILAIMAFTGLSMFAGTYTFHREILRGSSSDLTETERILEQDYFINPQRGPFVALYAQAYAECFVYGFNRTNAFSYIEYFSAYNGNQASIERLGAAGADCKGQQMLTPIINHTEHVLATRKNSLIIRHKITFPQGAYGTMRTFLRVSAY